MLIYLSIINIISFIFFGIDKFFDIRKMYRISEFSLLLLAFLGGVFGTLLAIKVFNYKTNKKKFKVNLIIYLIFWIFIIIKIIKTKGLQYIFFLL